MRDGTGLVPILMLLTVGALSVFQLRNPAFFVRLHAGYIVLLAKSLGFQVDPVPISPGKPEGMILRWARVMLAVAVGLLALLLTQLLSSR